MFRNLAVPTVILAVVTLTGCQAIFKTGHSEGDATPTPQPIPEARIPDSAMVTPDPQSKPESPEKTHSITVREKVVQIPAHLDGRLILGINEMATLPNQNLEMEAKLDTGAANTSVDARNIRFFERDSKKWVKFDLPRTSRGTIPMELPVKEIIRIKRPGTSAIERPVVNLTLAIGDITQPVEVSLTDRTRYNFPLLIGRNFIKDLAVVDVKQQYIARKTVIDTRSKKVKAPLDKKSYSRAIEKSVSTKGLVTLGSVEYITLAETGVALKARIDTGALTSSLDARELRVFKKQAKEWVHFKLPDSTGQMVTIEQPVTRFVRIKRHGAESERRPVITMNARIGNISQPTQFSLRDRDNYEYPVLVGARFLENTAVVDVSREYTSAEGRLPKEREKE